MKKRDRALIELSRRLDALGISLTDQEALRRIEMTLHRWAERECNGEVERDEKTGKTYAAFYGGTMADAHRRWPVADKERGALRRLAAIMARYPALWYYHQGDPRGCALYVGRTCDMPSCGAVPCDHRQCEGWPRVLSSHYTRGVAVCI